MTHLPHLINDLALILVVAAIVTLLFKWLKQPLVLGYIIAGLLVGPHFRMFPSIYDLEGVTVWADIGVIILLFNLGLEFSFKKLMKVGGVATITGTFQVAGMLLIGYIMGQLLGWGLMDSIFLGGIIAISSTTIIVRAFEELGIKTQKFTGVVLGVLIIEDLVAVLLMVLLSTLALSQKFAGTEMLVSVLKLGFFLVLWFLVGIFVVPSFLKFSRKLINDETMLIISLALCFVMVILATEVGFSSALGAFIMGSVLAETTQAERIEHLIKPIKDLFGAVFFVSVGMLLDPNILQEYGLEVVVITIVVIFGKLLFVTIGAMIAGLPLKQALQSGMSLSQIGEFSFIIASLGLTLGVTGHFLYPIAVGVSVITTFVTPYMIRYTGPVYEAIARVVPEKWVSYHGDHHVNKPPVTDASDWKLLLGSYVTTIVVNSVLILGLMLISLNFVVPNINLGHERWSSIVCAFLTLLLMSPFLWALAVRRADTQVYYNLWLNNKYNRWPLVALELTRICLAIFFVGFLFDQLLSTKIAFAIILAVIAVVIVIFSGRLREFYHRIESRFLFNLNARDAEGTSSEAKTLLPWDAHLIYFNVSPEAVLIGKPLSQLSLREKYGINIAIIERGRLKINIPSKDECLYPGDRIAVLGTDEQLKAFGAIVEPKLEGYVPAVNEVNLQQIIIEAGFPYIGMSISESDIKGITGGLIVGIERQGERILNPESSFVFSEGDLLWVVGDSELRRKIYKKPGKK